MTTAQERYRAICWGQELLCSVVDDKRLSSEFRARAAVVHDAYPLDDLVATLQLSGVQALPIDLEARLNAAWEFFRRLKRDTLTPEDVRNKTIYTLRHFPLPGSAYWASLPNATTLLVNWIDLPPSSGCGLEARSSMQC